MVKPNSTKPPITQSPGRKQLVEGMFNGIAPHYDRLNHLLSFGIDRSWRKRLVRELKATQPHQILDLATGTADLAIAAARNTDSLITGTDIADEMLEIGRQKVAEYSLSHRIELLRADSENLPFENGRFDAAMVAYGVRNYEDLPRGLAEMQRVLREGASAYVLEFSHPSSFPMKQLYRFYSRYIMPVAGRLVSNHSTAYSYLPESVRVFPSGEAFCQLLKEAGFKRTQAIPLTFGITTLYIATK